jgi:hypothetical protein
MEEKSPTRQIPRHIQTVEMAATVVMGGGAVMRAWAAMAATVAA